MKDNKRYPHSYKTKNDAYNKAMRRAKKEKGKLSNLLENVVICYARGFEIKAVKIAEGGSHATGLDIFSMDNSEIIKSTKQ